MKSDKTFDFLADDFIANGLVVEVLERLECRNKRDAVRLNKLVLETLKAVYSWATLRIARVLTTYGSCFCSVSIFICMNV